MGLMGLTALRQKKKEALESMATILTDWIFGMATPHPKWGICKNINKQIKEEFLSFIPEYKKHFTTWPEYSGNFDFPISSPAYPERPDMAYMCTAETYQMWERGTPYADARYRLCKHLIKEMTREIEELAREIKK